MFGELFWAIWAIKINKNLDLTLLFEVIAVSQLAIADGIVVFVCPADNKTLRRMHSGSERSSQMQM